MNFKQTIKVRSTLLSEAIAETSGLTPLRGKASVNMYAELLGFRNNPDLLYKANKNPKQVATAFENDVHFTPENLNIVKKYLPEIESYHFDNALLISDYMLEMGGSDKWKMAVFRVLKKIEDIRSLRANRQDLAYKLTETLQALISSPEAKLCLRFRLQIIILILQDFAEHNDVEMIGWPHILDALRPDIFTTLTWQYDLGELDMPLNTRNAETIYRYIRTERDNYQDFAQQAWMAALPVLSDLSNQPLPPYKEYKQILHQSVSITEKGVYVS